MALSRKFLSAMGIDAEKIDEIIQAHSETVEALKEERDSYKESADKYEKVQKDLEAATRKIEELSKDDAYKVKYDALKEDFDKYKKESEAQKVKATKTDAFRNLLKEIGISEKRIESVIKVSGDAITNLVLDNDGKIADADKLKSGLSEEWADFIVKDAGKQGADPANPPKGHGGKILSREEIAKIDDTSERQAALKEYLLAQEA